jgi:hypothetical protein
MSKYKAVKTVAHGRTFDSKAEAKRAGELILMEKSGLIQGLNYQVVFELADSVVINGRKRPPLKYVADFVYVRAGESIVEDCKGMLTPVYKIKRHLMKAVFGIDILETK